MDSSILNRAFGALIGGAVGDEMGMPFEFLTREEIKNKYGYINDFLRTEKMNMKNCFSKGEDFGITDDTSESAILARVLIENGRFDEAVFNSSMKKWAIDQKVLESDIIGPSSRKYLEALVNGKNPQEWAIKAKTNGSAMRVAPIGVKYYSNLSACIEAAAASSVPSHASKPAVAASCAVAAGVAPGVMGGYSVVDILRIAYDAAIYGEKKGFDISSPSVSKRIGLIEHIVDSCGDSCDMNDVIDEAAGIFGAGTMAYESVPFAFAMFYAANGSPEIAIPAAVNAGDDTDTNASICGTICGAFSGAESIPEDWRKTAESTSGIDFELTAKKLICVL